MERMLRLGPTLTGCQLPPRLVGATPLVHPVPDFQSGWAPRPPSLCRGGSRRPTSGLLAWFSSTCSPLLNIWDASCRLQSWLARRSRRARQPVEEDAAWVAALVLLVLQQDFAVDDDVGDAGRVPDHAGLAAGQVRRGQRGAGGDRL